LEVVGTKGVCPAGEIAGARSMAERKIPVLSCEGACIRGEIARVAANMVAKEGPYARACHGEALTVPHSAMAKWVKEADKVVLIDGCFLRCHGRLLRDVVASDRLVEFDALGHYKKYTDLIEIDAVPEQERKEVARDVADWVLASMREAE
jgi:uncharacterized metal-binding protein